MDGSSETLAERLTEREQWHRSYCRIGESLRQLLIAGYNVHMHTLNECQTTSIVEGGDMRGEQLNGATGASSNASIYDSVPCNTPFSRQESTESVGTSQDNVNNILSAEHLRHSLLEMLEEIDLRVDLVSDTDQTVSNSGNEDDKEESMDVDGDEEEEESSADVNMDTTTPICDNINLDVNQAESIRPDTSLPAEASPRATPETNHVAPFVDLVQMFSQLLTSFYFEVFLWMYVNILTHPRSEITRTRLRYLGQISSLSLEDITRNILVGYFHGFHQGRRQLLSEICTVLRSINHGIGGVTIDSVQSRRLRELSIQMGVHLNSRQILRSFSSVIADLVNNQPTPPPVIPAYVPVQTRANNRLVFFVCEYHMDE